jgi:hypothetical protein
MQIMQPQIMNAIKITTSAKLVNMILLEVGVAPITVGFVVAQMAELFVVTVNLVHHVDVIDITKPILFSFNLQRITRLYIVTNYVLQ